MIMCETFKNAVLATSEIETAYKPGLRALGKNSSKIHTQNTQDLNGSVDIDAATKEKYPNENRWDYCIGYKNQALFIEVHPGSSSEVGTILKKLDWLKKWLMYKAPEINSIKANKAFFWVTSGNVSLLKGSSQYRAAVSNNILPQSSLNLK